MIAVAIIFLPLLFVSVSGSCLNPVACPCGTSNRSNILCSEKNPLGSSDPCSLLSNCETCREELDACLTCPPGFYGPTCSKKYRATRRKRQVQIGDCPIIFEPANGKMRCRNQQRHGYCRASCDSGYTFAGNETELEIIMECRRGSWYPLSAFPTCVIGLVESECRDPGTPVGGNRYPPRRPYPGLFEKDQQVAFGCIDIEFVIQGESVLTCLRDGSWSAPLPECVRVNKECPFPGVDDNGNVVVRGRGSAPPNPDDSFPPGTRLVYTCKRGYTRAGPSSLTCRRNGEWSDQLYPLCVEEGSESNIHCPNLGPVHHGIVSLQLSTRASNPDVELPAGTIVTYSCRKGYTLQGSEEITCDDDGKWSARLPSCVEECGLRSAEVEGLVTHGENTEKGQWPWMVSISIVRGENNVSNIVCGGALLDRRTVLTAAHCLVGEEPYFLLHFGKYYRSTRLDDNKVQVRRSGRIIIHPKYDPVTFNNDIALIRFSPNIRYDSRILPVCLPTPESSRDNLVPQTIGIVTGWGRNELDTDPTSLMMAQLPMQSQATCAQSYTGLFYDTSTMICAGYPQGKVSTCNGDSGSGLVFKDAHSQGRFVVEGIVSYNHRGSCGMPGRYTVYTRVSHFMDWIRRNAFEH